jgi:hypothetical protein
LASDVAALANTAGGLIVIGIADDGQARGAAASTVALSDVETARMQQTVASLIAPLPDFDMIAVEDPMNPGTGFLLIAVPPSQRQPHAVIVNQGLRFLGATGPQRATSPKRRSPRRTVTGSSQSALKSPELRRLSKTSSYA